MKKLTVILVAFAVLATVGTATVSAQTINTSGMLSQIEQLKAMLKNLQNQKELVVKLENKIGDKFEGLQDSLKTIAALPKPGKMHVSFEELGNGRVDVNIKNAAVIEISTSTIYCITTPCNQPANLKIKVNGLSFDVNVNPATDVLVESRAKTTIDKYKVGDYVNVYGAQDQTTPTLIHAKIVRNVSLTKRIIQDRVTAIKDKIDDNLICIQVITWAKNPETGEVKQFPTPCSIPKNWVKVEAPGNSTTTNSTSTASAAGGTILTGTDTGSTTTSTASQ